MFIPDGAQVSASDLTRVVGLNPVMIPAAFVPPSGARPGYPYEHIGQAIFIPDEDGQEGSSHTGSRPAAKQGDPAVPDNPMPWRQLSSAPPVAGVTGPGITGNGLTDSDQAPDVTQPRRGVRSTQANFSAAIPSPNLDGSRGAIDAAARALRLEPSDGAVPISADRITVASWRVPRGDMGIVESPR